MKKFYLMALVVMGVVCFLSCSKTTSSVIISYGANASIFDSGSGSMTNLVVDTCYAKDIIIDSVGYLEVSVRFDSLLSPTVALWFEISPYTGTKSYSINDTTVVAAVQQKFPYSSGWSTAWNPVRNGIITVSSSSAKFVKGSLMFKMGKKTLFCNFTAPAHW